MTIIFPVREKVKVGEFTQYQISISLRSDQLELGSTIKIRDSFEITECTCNLTVKNYRSLETDFLFQFESN